MIVIKKIELIETPRDWWEYYESEFPGFASVTENACISPEIQRKTVRGRRFCRSDGEEIICTDIGVSDEAGEILGLQYEAWETMERTYEMQISALNRHLAILRKDKDKLITWLKMPFYKKLYFAIVDCVLFERLIPKY